MSDYRVANLKAAVDLAEQWRTSGSHTWFRGQNRLWPIGGSLGRMQAARMQGPTEYMDRFKTDLGQFCDWLGSVPELRYLLNEEQVHAFFAVLQHYGMPTHYVDFTVKPKVAGFFAGVGSAADQQEEGCIIAIDPDDWVKWLRYVAEAKQWPSESWPEKVVVNVPNLWRMEAQSGFFVYLPIENAEGYMPVDRIIFTHDGSGFELCEDDIYPSSKSPLEQRLDEFFTERLVRRGNQEYLRPMMNEFISHGQGVSLPFERPESSKWLRPGAGAHDSWRSIPEAWRDYVHEKLEETRDGTVARMGINLSQPLAQRRELQETVLRFISEHPGVRKKTVDWEILPAANVAPAGWIEFAASAAKRAWDGVRLLPFTDDQVAGCVAMTLVLACADVSDRPALTARDFSALLGPTLQMELSNNRNTTARAAMAEVTYERTLRPDLQQVLVPELLDRPRQQLRQILSPEHLFRFDRLADAFAYELIPTQVLIQRHDLAIFFSPVRTPIIGAA